MGQRSRFHLLRNSLFFIILQAIVLCSQIFASKVTIDADGNATYTSLDAFLQALQNKSTDPDTVLFSGNKRHTYSMSYYVSDTSAGSIVFLGNSTNPDSFPIITLTGTEYYAFFQGTNIRFERLAFTGAAAFASGDGAHQKVFSNCVIFNFSSLFLKIAGQYNSSFRFENCLFYGNTHNDGLFSFHIWGGQPVINFINCTFDSNKSVFGSFPDGYLTFVNIKNCVFSGAPSYFNSDNNSANLKSKTTYSLTSEASGYTSSCIYSATPGYAVTTRTKASDFKLPVTSQAKGIADTTGAPLFDIAGQVRGVTNGKGDAGCWAIVLGGGAEIIANPRDTTVAAGSVVTFSVTAKGTEKIHYYWYVDGVAVPGNDTSVYSFSCTAANNGNKISCKVENVMGKDSSTAAILTVRTKPSIELNVTEAIASEGDTITFSAVVTGGGIKFQWFKDAVKLSDDTLATLTLNAILKSDSGRYVCVASNIAGLDSAAAFLHVVGAEPHISLEPRDTMVIEGGTAVFSVASTGRNLSFAWYKENSSIALGTTAQLTLTNVQITDAGKYFCIVNNSYGSDTSRSAVLTVTQSELINPLAVSAVWNGDETLDLKLSGFNLLSPDTVSLVSIWCLKEGTTLLRDTIYASAFPAGVDNVIKTYSNPLFSGERTSLTWMVQVKGVQGKLSNIVQDSVTVGFPRTANNAKLSVEAFSKDSISVRWSIPVLDQIDSIRIWYGTDSLGKIPVANGEVVKFIEMRAVNDSVITLKGLKAETLYNIAIQVQKIGSLWSFITDSGKVSATTTSSTNSGNSITLTELTYDTLTNLINVSWTVDTTGRIASKMVAGVTWGVGGFTLAKPSKVMVPATQNKCQIDLGENLLFDTTYHISLWLGVITLTDTVWIEPTQYSKDSVAIPSPVFQKIVYFEKDKNITYAFGRDVVLQKGGGYNDPPYTDTVNVFKPSALQISEGLVPVSLGVSFLRCYPTDSIVISIRYKPDSIPDGLSASDIRMYEFDAKTGLWNFIANVEVDTASKMVKKRVRSLSELPNPLMLMIDRKEPLVTIPPDTNSVISINDVIETTLGLSDNIGKLRVTITGWGGVTGEPDTIFDTLTDAKVLPVSIPKKNIYIDFGLKAVITVSDGRFTKKIDISRSVNDSLAVSSIPMKWKPINTNLVLAKPRVPDVFKSFCQGEWKYDSIHFRIFTWGDSLGKPGKSGWIEYSNSPDIQDMFSLIPGRIIWVKTREQITLSGGYGYTVSLKEPFKKIVLKAQNWTDFTSPFKFNTYIDDILDSTAGPDAHLRQQLKASLLFSQWEEGNNGEYNAISYHIPIIPDESRPDTFIESSSQYSIYNVLDKDIVLRVPAIPLKSSQYYNRVPSPAKMKNTQQWGVSLKAHTRGEKLQSVYFGYSERENKIVVPQSPSFSKLKISLLDNGNRMAGTVITNENAGNGYTVPVFFENGTDKESSISYSLEKIAYFPENFRAVLIDPQTGIVERGTEISIGSKMSAYRVLVIGDDHFIAKQAVQLKPVSFALVKMYPNPCRNLMNIRFTIPYSGVKKMDIKIFDQLGRTVWNKRIDNGLLPGSVNTVTWNPKASSIVSGTYIVRVTAINENGSVHGVKQQKVMYIP